MAKPKKKGCAFYLINALLVRKIAGQLCSGHNLGVSVLADELLLKKIQTSLIVLCCYMYDIVFFIFTHQTEYSNYSITVLKGVGPQVRQYTGPHRISFRKMASAVRKCNKNKMLIRKQFSNHGYVTVFVPGKRLCPYERQLYLFSS